MKHDKHMEMEMEEAPLIRPEEESVEKMLGGLETPKSPLKGTKGSDSLRDKKNHNGKDAESSNSCCGFFLGLFLAASIFFCWFVLFICDDFVGLAEGDHDQPLVLTSDRLPMINRNKTIIYVVRPEGLSIAYNFVLRNPQLPIDKLIYKPPGPNSTLTVFPIPRGDIGRPVPITEIRMSLGIVSVAFALLCLCIMGMYYGMYSCRDSFCIDLGPNATDEDGTEDMSLAETILEVAAYFEDEVMREKKIALEKYKQKNLVSKKLKEKDGADKPLLA